MIIWITGLSGAGKTTLAKAVVEQLHDTKVPCVLLDGDAFRAAVGDATTGYDKESRLQNAQRLARFAKLLESQQLTVVVATISLFHAIHTWNRQHFNQYVEVLLEADLSTLKTQDPKGLYANNQQLAGLDIPVEFPTAPHLTIQRETTTPKEIATTIVAYVENLAHQQRVS